MTAIVMVSILSAFAYGIYKDYVPGAKEARAAHDLHTLADAFAAYSRDNPGMVMTTMALADLKGQYLDTITIDPWDNDYIVDTFFQRVISRGPDGKLGTLVPELLPPAGDGPTQSDADGDDVVRPFGTYGTIAVVSGGSLYTVRPDGSRLIVLLNDLGGTGTASLSPDRNRFLLARGGRLFLLTVGADSHWENPLVSVGQPLQGSDPSWAHDAVKFCYVGPSATSIGISEVTTAPASGSGDLPAPPSTIVAAGLAGATSPSLSRDNRSIVFVTGAGDLAAAASASESTLTTLNVKDDGSAWRDAVRVAWSPDGKQLAYTSKDGGVYLRSLRGPYPGGTPPDKGRLRIADGTFGALAWSPDGTRLALARGSQLLLTPARAGARAPFPLLVLTTSSEINGLSWR